MGNYKEIYGNLITFAVQGEFDVITHGCNCFCRMKKGVAPQVAASFGVDKYPLETNKYKGDMNKLGQIDIGYEHQVNGKSLWVVNAYTQYKIKKFNQYDYSYTTTENPFDYEAFTLCMRKINYVFSGKHIGLPAIGSHLAGGDWKTIKQIIQKELKDCDVTIVLFKP